MRSPVARPTTAWQEAAPPACAFIADDTVHAVDHVRRLLQIRADTYTTARDLTQVSSSTLVHFNFAYTVSTGWIVQLV